MNLPPLVRPPRVLGRAFGVHDEEGVRVALRAEGTKKRTATEGAAGESENGSKHEEKGMKGRMDAYDLITTGPVSSRARREGARGPPMEAGEGRGVESRKAGSQNEGKGK